VALSDYELVKLANGVFSVRALACQETFHPVIGPVAEAEALYVNQLHLPERMARHEGTFVIWDIGLGAAANVLTVLRACQGAGGPVRVLSFDVTLDPLLFGLNHALELGYFGGWEKKVRALAQHHRVQFQNGRQAVDWTFHPGDFPSLIQEPDADRFPKPQAILFDAYSPAKNPEMWTLPLFQRLFELLDPARPCAMPTYSRSTLLRVTLLVAGFFVGTGHATGEKEETTIAANDRGLIAHPLDATWLNRARNSTSAEPIREAVYRQAPLSQASWEQLRKHAQFGEKRTRRG
jgi:tRNA U34 5-methylaminomethyl-2-thiouridine-forming methyltransferase MnmC